MMYYLLLISLIFITIAMMLYALHIIKRIRYQRQAIENLYHKIDQKLEHNKKVMYELNNYFGGK